MWPPAQMTPCPVICLGNRLHLALLSSSQTYMNAVQERSHHGMQGVPELVQEAAHCGAQLQRCKQLAARGL